MRIITGRMRANSIRVAPRSPGIADRLRRCIEEILLTLSGRIATVGEIL
jgi:hypothetical protein